MRAIVASARPKYSDLKIGLTGLPVLETDEMDASNRDSNLAGYLALGGVALVYVLAYRGIRYPLITVVTLMAGTFWSMGWLVLTVGHLNILSSTFAVMLIGIGDYGVLWVTHYDDQRRTGLGVLPAILHTAGEIGPAVLTAGTSTALAFFAAMLADFQAVAELGWIAGCGVFFCAFACFTVLPALMYLTDRRPVVGGGLAVITADGERIQSMHRSPLTIGRLPVWLPFLARRPRWVLAAGLVAARGMCSVRRPGRLRPQLAQHARPDARISRLGTKDDRAAQPGRAGAAERGRQPR